MPVSSRRIRSFPIAILAALAVLATATSPVAAAYKFTSADTGMIRVVDFANGDVWDSWGHFTAQWDKTFMHEDGMSYWNMKYVHMLGLIEVYSQCPWHFCTGDASVFSANFLNANGASVFSVTLPIGSCGISSAYPSGWGGWTRCKANFHVPITATQIRFNWLLTERPATGGVIAWQKSKTVPI